MDDTRTVFVGNLSDQVNEELLFELFLQAGPLERVKIPTDRDGRKSTFGFVTFKHEASVPYTVELLSGIKLFEKTLNIKPRNGGAHKQHQVQRSFSVPEVPQQQNEHFNMYGNMGPSHTSFEDLLKMGHMMNISYNTPENNYSNDYGGGRQHNQEPQRLFHDRGSFRDRETDRQEFDHGRDRDRRHDYPNNRSHHRRQPDKKQHTYDRSRGRRNNRY